MVLSFYISTLATAHSGCTATHSHSSAHSGSAVGSPLAALITLLGPLMLHRTLAVVGYALRHRHPRDDRLLLLPGTRICGGSLLLPGTRICWRLRSVPPALSSGAAAL